MEPYSIYKTVFNLRENGLTYKQIQDELQKIGKNISVSHIQVMSKSMYEELGKEEASYVSDEIIYNLRQKGLTYMEMEAELKKQGKRVSTSSLATRCKKIYKEKKEKMPKASSIKISDEEIFKLREKRLAYDGIVKHFEEKGISVSITFIQRKCKQIYQEKGLKEPKPEYINSKLESDFDKEIVRLREEEGLSYKEIAKAFPDKKISRQGICNRYKRIENYNNKQMSKMILNLMTTKKASLEQIKIIADYYGVDLEKTFDSIEER